MATKICPKCGIEKHSSEFGIRGIYLKSWCKKCEVISVREHQKRNPQKYKNISRNSDLTTKYGITLEQYNELYLAQEGKCCICKEYFESLVVDHNHESTVVRGLLCPACNFMLGHAKDNIEILSNAIIYLTESNERRSKKSS